MSTYTEMKFQIEADGPATIKISKVNDSEEIHTITDNTTLIYKTYCTGGKPISFKVTLLSGSSILIKKLYTTIRNEDHDIFSLSEKIKDPSTGTITVVQESPKSKTLRDKESRHLYGFVPFTLTGGQTGEILFICKVLHFFEWSAIHINNNNRV